MCKRQGQKAACKAFKKHCKDSGWNQDQAADNYGTYQSHISSIFTGVNPPTKPMLKDIGYKVERKPAVIKYVRVK